MESNLEYNYIKNQININENIKNLLKNQISEFMILCHNNRKTIGEIDNVNTRLESKLEEILSKSKTLVKYEN